LGSATLNNSRNYNAQWEGGVTIHLSKEFQNKFHHLKSECYDWKAPFLLGMMDARFSRLENQG
jgi:hypothetical protein